MPSKETLAVRIDAMDHRITEIVRFREQITARNEVTMDKRLDAMNEFRTQLTDQAQTFITRNEIATVFLAHTARMDEMSKTLTERMNGMNESLTTQMDTLRREAERRRGTIEASRATYSYVIAAIGGLAGLVGIIMAILAIVR